MAVPEQPSPEQQMQKIEVLDSFVTSVIMDVVLTVTDVDTDDDGAVLERAIVLHKKFLKIPRASDNMKTRTVRTRMFIIKHVKDLL